ncbi:receptor-transporting protein 3-like [Watersipora subatra]|uniref:receptor-transporting protein 3-like n=1 Tax=Watersipora subatra TaxID=2589382 RepID=UPI00355C60B7
MRTRDIPLKPMRSVDPDEDKKIGRSLSCYTRNMEVVWHGEFNRLCQHFFPHRWYLSPYLGRPLNYQWYTFTDCAKVRFLCKFCDHGWTSMKGRVVFNFQFNESSLTGIVFFRLFGQKCQRCTPETFEHAMWYPEEVIKVIGNLFNRIGQEYYGFYRPCVRVDRRPGKPQAKHNKECCQACAESKNMFPEWHDLHR